jgi:protein subunit release factor B
MRTVLIIKPGAGGEESIDFARMLKDMYMGWAERHKMLSSALKEKDNSWVVTLGSDSDTLEDMEQERGVHRLVRISPFDRQSRRHTSFASVDIEGAKELEDKTSFGPRARNYVLYPYQQAMDFRKNYTTDKVFDVLAGGVELDAMRAAAKDMFALADNKGQVVGHIEHRTLTQEEMDHALTLKPTI